MISNGGKAGVREEEKIILTLDSRLNFTLFTWEESLTLEIFTISYRTVSDNHKTGLFLAKTPVVSKYGTFLFLIILQIV